MKKFKFLCKKKVENWYGKTLYEKGKEYNGLEKDGVYHIGNELGSSSAFKEDDMKAAFDIVEKKESLNEAYDRAMSIL